MSNVASQLMWRWLVWKDDKKELDTVRKDMVRRINTANARCSNVSLAPLNPKPRPFWYTKP